MTDSKAKKTTRIWVDADSCPAVIREIICRAAIRTKTPATFVANQYLNLPNSPFLTMRQVSSGFDVADDEIVAMVNAGDLVITSDLPLADEVIDKGAQVISHRGEALTKDNIKPRLNMRDFMDTLRASGVQSGGQAPLSQSERQQFANRLDRFLATRQ